LEQRRAASFVRIRNVFERAIGQNSCVPIKGFQTNVSLQRYQPSVNYVTEIEKYLSNDLTTQGISSITSLSDKTVRNGAQLESKNQSLPAGECFLYLNYHLNHSEKVAKCLHFCSSNSPKSLINLKDTG